MIPDLHRREHALFRARDLAPLIPGMLPAATYDLDAGRNLGVVPNRGSAYDAVAANVNMGTHCGVPVGKERPKRNAARQGTFHQGEPIERHAQVVTRNSGRHGAAVGEKREYSFQPAEPGGCGQGQCGEQTKAAQKKLGDAFHSRSKALAALSAGHR
jgi:hypothetical protein